MFDSKCDVMANTVRGVFLYWDADSDVTAKLKALGKRLILILKSRRKVARADTGFNLPTKS
jgi:hypothetical protein